jgi:chromosome partitioning protein
MGAVIAFTSRKGGVGKTSLLWHLAGLWASGGLRVRLIDMDSQASLSQACLGPEAVDALRPSDTVEAVFGGVSSKSVERPTRWDRITLVPSHLGLRPPASSARLELRSQEAELTLIDTPPDTTSPLVKAALLAADFVLSPVDPECFGAASVLSVQSLCYSVAVAHNPELCLLGFVVNRRARLAVHAVVEDTLRRLHGEQIFATAIPDLAAFKEAALAREPLSHYSPRSKAAAIIRGLGEEVMERIERAAARRAA